MPSGRSIFSQRTILFTTSRNTMYRLLGAILLLIGIGIFYLAVSTDRPAQNEPDALRGDTPNSSMRSETIAARGAWRAIPDTAPQAQPAPPMFMIRDLQRELKRVGCYEGEIHGVRTKSTRDAMDRFTELVNAKLPTHEPDIVLLSLVRGYAGNTGCDRSVTAAAPNVAPPPRAPPLEGYMALAGPPAEAPAPSAAPPRHNPRTSEPDRQTRTEDWIAELWKKQAN